MTCVGTAGILTEMSLANTTQKNITYTYNYTTTSNALAIKILCEKCSKVF